MHAKRIEELKREEQVLLAWIREVTAGKQARLCQIRRELRGEVGDFRSETTERKKGLNRLNSNGLR